MDYYERNQKQNEEMAPYLAILFTVLIALIIIGFVYAGIKGLINHV